MFGTKQYFSVKWGNILSKVFRVSNGVRQGGVLSPCLFNTYVEELSKRLKSLKSIGCELNNILINHFIYADDTVLIAPSPYALQQLINCCSEFAADFDFIYNTKKTKILVHRPDNLKFIYVPYFILNNSIIPITKCQKYLGYLMTNDLHDDVNIYKQVSLLYSRGNVLIRQFSHCSSEVKAHLFKTYCSNLYCSQLWSVYKASSINKIKIAYENIYRYLFNLGWEACIPHHMAITQCRTTSC